MNAVLSSSRIASRLASSTTCRVYRARQQASWPACVVATTSSSTSSGRLLSSSQDGGRNNNDEDNKPDEPKGFEHLPRLESANPDRIKGIQVNPDSVGSTVLPGNLVYKKYKWSGNTRKIPLELKHGYFWMVRLLDLFTRSMVYILKLNASQKISTFYS